MISDRHTDTEREGGARVRVRLLLFGAAREAAGGAESHALEVDAPATAASVFEAALGAFPALGRFGRSLLVAVNEEYAAPGRAVREGDEVAIFPPVSGGAGDESKTDENPKGARDFFELTTEPIDVGEVARRVVPAACGATVTLDGYVREWTRGRRTLHLTYEAYAPMALRELGRLCRELHERFDIAHVGVVHRTGRLEIGETSVVISVSAPHRRAAFEACEWAIRELKRTVPVWKKEFFADGEVWVEGEGAPEKPAGGVVKEASPETLS
ncbi:MAG TPA: molybdenum cofactor biosynthesis protein MoaE [Pyrinomonadaceae bacterium]|jgi:molybdopterin synthase catalytic subunit|nr:molybdenum cofactor biosynthesis protein MoaE [Pyrinomonadaceae bacterium]